ncbi:hypothetical protein CC2G_011530 [Coprinopsis cinerea AmutBmut pab1-1]|nr:hypothetical protein CC2G_011530 [Coprinopsis cinerea AmutBmut pab1-1]
MFPKVLAAFLVATTTMVATSSGAAIPGPPAPVPRERIPPECEFTLIPSAPVPEDADLEAEFSFQLRTRFAQEFPDIPFTNPPDRSFHDGPDGNGFYSVNRAWAIEGVSDEDIVDAILGWSVETFPPVTIPSVSWKVDSILCFIF